MDSGTAVLTAPADRHGPEPGRRRGADSADPRFRRDLSEDFADPAYEDEAPQGRRRGGVRVRFGGLPRGRWGWVAAALMVMICAAAGAGIFVMAKSFVLQDERFVIPTSSAIQFQGNAHVTRGELLNVFGEDVERNIFRVPLEERRLELEHMPWVAHATVMRLLPNRLRVSVVERTPVAFVREGNRVGLVDGGGVLLGTTVQAKGEAPYSFPVVTGISAGDPLSTRAARMKLYERFTAELDGSGEKISQGLSEVDLSNPEDVKALIPDHAADILVHFGQDNFLDRYRRFEQHLPEWRTVYPKLSSVDMRYERQVVLEMQPGSGVPMTTSTNAGETGPAGDAVRVGARIPRVDHQEKTGMRGGSPVHPAAAKHGLGAMQKLAAKGPAHGVARGPVAAKKNASKGAGKAKPHAVAKHTPVATRHSSGAPLSHPAEAVRQ